MELQHNTTLITKSISQLQTFLNKDPCAIADATGAATVSLPGLLFCPGLSGLPGEPLGLLSGDVLLLCKVVVPVIIGLLATGFVVF